MNRLTALAFPVLIAALVSSSALAAVPEGWTDDVAAAKAKAAASDKDLFMDFTGSDWCGWCIRLKDEVFTKQEFKATVPDDFVLVYLDFPNNVPQSDEVIQQNQRLQQEFNVQGFPTIALTDAQGRPYAFTGYRDGGVEPYLEHIEELKARRVARDEALAEAEAAEGVEKAKAFDRAMEAVTLDLAVAHYGDVVEQIIALDSDDEAGLKSKYQAAYQQAKIGEQMQEAMGLLSSGNLDAGLAKLDAILETQNPQPEARQLILAIKGQVKMQSGDPAAARELLNQSLQAAPESDIAPNIQQLLDQLPAE